MFCPHPLGETALPVPLDWVSREGPMGVKDRKGKGRENRE